MCPGMPSLRGRLPQDGRHGLITIARPSRAPGAFGQRPMGRVTWFLHKASAARANLDRSAHRGRSTHQETRMTSLSKTLSVAVAAIAFAAPAAFAQQTGHDMKPMMQKNNEKMMSMPMTGKPDVDFAMSMREHHMGAIEMAQWQLDHGSDPKMKEMARKIIADQKKRRSPSSTSSWPGTDTSPATAWAPVLPTAPSDLQARPQRARGRT